MKILTNPLTSTGFYDTIILLAILVTTVGILDRLLFKNVRLARKRGISMIKKQNNLKKTKILSEEDDTNYDDDVLSEYGDIDEVDDIDDLEEY